MSKIEVNKVGPQCGTTVTVGCGAGQTVVVDANTVTLGRCGGTVALASGASQTGFGREGSVDWQTGSIKTTTFTAASGEGYFVDTSSGAVTVNLPSGSAGAIVAFADYTRTFATHNLTIVPNGSNKIGGIAENAKLSVNGQSATFVFVDATEGWINVQETQTSQTGNVNFVSATGGTVTTSGDFKIHTFTSPGTFCVSAISTVDTARNTVGYVVVAGGGGGSRGGGGGGGAGGYREGRNVPIDNFTASPLVADAPTNAVTLTASGFPITVGAGGTGATSSVAGGSGGNSIFSTITATGGGGGNSRSNPSPPKAGVAGGSGGGGGGGCGPGGNPGGAGNTPPVSPSQGNSGGSGNGPSGTHAGGGGGGATGSGANAPGANCASAGNGGTGATSCITASPVTRAGGGGGSGRTSPGSSPGGSGGPGGGGNGEGNPNSPGSAGTANTGGGGGGTEFLGNNGFSGGSGIVIIRYKFQ
jgi:hypothetical protein